MGFQALVWVQPLRTQAHGALVEDGGRTVWDRRSALIFSRQEAMLELDSEVRCSLGCTMCLPPTPTPLGPPTEPMRVAVPRGLAKGPTLGR